MAQIPIEIKIGDTVITINTGITKAAKTESAARVAGSKTAEELELKLMASDDLDEDAEIQLNVEVLAYAEKLLKAGKRKELLDFLNRNKQRFNPDLKSWLADAIRAQKKSK